MDDCRDNQESRILQQLGVTLINNMSRKNDYYSVLDGMHHLLLGSNWIITCIQSIVSQSPRYSKLISFDFETI